MNGKKIFFLFVFGIFLISFVSASFGYDNPTLPKITSPVSNLTIIQNINQTITNNFDQSLNTTDNVQFQNLTLSDKITFAFGEFIDNIVDGWITITGSLNVTGNITSENVFIPQYVYSHTNETITLNSANVWENITFEQENADIKFGIEHNHSVGSSHLFTIAESGIYNLDLDLDVEDTSVGASDIDVASRGMYVNGTEIIGSVFETDIIKQGVETELSHNYLASLNAGDIIYFQFVADDVDVQISTHATFGDFPESASIIIGKVANL